MHPTQLIYCAVVYCADTAGLERGGWCSAPAMAPEALYLLPLPGKHKASETPQVAL